MNGIKWNLHFNEWKFIFKFNAKFDYSSILIRWKFEFKFNGN